MAITKSQHKIISINGGGGLSPADNARITVLEDNEYKIIYYEAISSDTGQVTVPTGATIILDEFTSGADAYVTTIENGFPSGTLPETAGGAPVDVSSFDALGNYVLTGVPNSYPVSLIYLLKIKAKDYSNLDLSNGIQVYDLKDEAVSPSVLTLFKNTSRVTHTGSLSNVALISWEILPGTMLTSDIINFKARVLTGAVSGAKNFRLYVNTVNSLTSGAPQQLALYGHVSVSVLMERNLWFSATNTLKVMAATTDYASEYNTNFNDSNVSTFTVNPSVTQYFILACALTGATQEAVVEYVNATIHR